MNETEPTGITMIQDLRQQIKRANLDAFTDEVFASREHGQEILRRGLRSFAEREHRLRTLIRKKDDALRQWLVADEHGFEPGGDIRYKTTLSPIAEQAISLTE